MNRYSRLSELRRRLLASEAIGRGEGRNVGRVVSWRRRVESLLIELEAEVERFQALRPMQSVRLPNVIIPRSAIVKK